VTLILITSVIVIIEFSYSLLATYNLYNIVDFSTRIDINSATAIDGFFIDKCKISNYTVVPVVNGLSDHDTQLLSLNNSAQASNCHYYTKRQVNRMNIENIMFNLSFETWDEVFADDDVDKIFNSFFNSYLRAFNNSFPVRKIFHKYSNRPWLTAGIRISCHHKRNLYMLCRDLKSPILLAHYKNTVKYSKML
jgi:hypothetical protein